MKHIFKVTALAAILATITAGTAAATAPAEITEHLTAYRQEVHEAAELEQQEMLADLRRVNGPYENGEFTWDVERWRPLVSTYFPSDRIDWALHIIECESHGDPNAKNPRSTASGLFQHLASMWDDRAEAAGWAGSDVFDPLANVAVAAWLLETGGPGHWVCKA